MIMRIKYVPFTGQSGAGKGTFIATLVRVCQRLGIRVQVKGIGDRIAELAKLPEENWPTQLRAYYKELMDVVYTGGKQSYHIIEEILKEMVTSAEAQNLDLFIVDGTLRDYKEVVFWKEIAATRDVYCAMADASFEECFRRLVERTKKDKRPDLSLKNKPGKPSVQRIRRKLRWFQPDVRETEIHEANLSLFKIFNDIPEELVEVIMQDFAFQFLEKLGFSTTMSKSEVVM